MSRYEKQIVIKQDLFNTIKGYLNANKEDEYQGDFNTISKTVIFDNGYQMDIKCCGLSDSASWAEAVLFNQNGIELSSSYCEDEFDGTWILEFDNDTYIVDVLIDREINAFDEALKALGCKEDPFDYSVTDYIDLTQSGKVAFEKLISILNFLRQNNIITFNEDALDEFMSRTDS